MLDGFSRLLYPGQYTVQYALMRWLRGFRIAIPVYVPVYLTSTFLFSMGRAVRAPVATLKRVISGIALSSTFLTTYCAIGVCMVPLLRRLGFRYSVAGRFAPLTFCIAGVVAGSSLFIEKKSRRIELALFVWAKACDIMWILGKENPNPIIRKVVTGLPGQMLLFGLSLSSIMHAYLRHPHMIRPAYRGIMRRFFDADNRHVFL